MLIYLVIYLQLIRGILNMKIECLNNESDLIIKVAGSINTQTAPDFEKEIMPLIDENIKTIHLDFMNLDYISSAGLRVILLIAKKIHGEDVIVIENVKDNIKEVFEMTGFTSFIKVL